MTTERMTTVFKPTVKHGGDQGEVPLHSTETCHTLWFDLYRK